MRGLDRPRRQRGWFRALEPAATCVRTRQAAPRRGPPSSTARRAGVSDRLQIRFQFAERSNDLTYIPSDHLIGVQEFLPDRLFRRDTLVCLDFKRGPDFVAKR